MSASSRDATCIPPRVLARRRLDVPHPKTPAMKLEGHSSLRHLHQEPTERVLRGARHRRITLDRFAKSVGRTQSGRAMGTTFEESQELFPFRHRFATRLRTREGNHAHFDPREV